eukprot:1918812-Pleurochrysis_carterae.AAC.2
MLEKKVRATLFGETPRASLWLSAAKYASDTKRPVVRRSKVVAKCDPCSWARGRDGNMGASGCLEAGAVEHVWRRECARERRVSEGRRVTCKGRIRK